jgi:uncharacterized membrane protein
VAAPGQRPLVAFEAYLDQTNTASGSGNILADSYATDIKVSARSDAGPQAPARSHGGERGGTRFWLFRAKIESTTLSFNHNVENVVQVVEGVGVAIMVLGGVLVMVHSGVLYLIPSRRARAYHYFRKHLGRVILLGLEVLIVADIIRTVIVDPTAVSVAVLATIVVVRIVLSWSLAVEIDGVWPWRKEQTFAAGPEGAKDGTAKGGQAAKRPAC